MPLDPQLENTPWTPGQLVEGACVGSVLGADTEVVAGLGLVSLLLNLSLLLLVSLINLE